MKEEVYLKDIAGYEEVKEEAKKIISILKDYKKYEQLGAYIPKGLILSGRPGVGKTLLAKAISNESGVPLFEFETDERETEAATIKSIKDLFFKAKENAPAIIFIDELDELIMTQDFKSDYSRKIAKILFTEIDGISSSEGILVIATTNYKSFLPPALMRSGRMDKRISIDLPDSYSREEIFRYYLNKHECLQNINAKALGNRTKGFTGADIKTLINETIIDCVANNRNNITIDDFEKNIPTIMFQDIKKVNRSGPSDITCYHEIGHFIVEYIISGKIGSISTESFGEVKGHVLFDNDDLRNNEMLTRESLKPKLMTLLGGIAAEEAMLNDVSYGTISDVRNARKYIRMLINVGAYGFDKLPNDAVLDRATGICVDLSNERRLLVEEKEKTLMNEAFENAKKIINENKELVKFIFRELKEKDRLSVIEVKELIESFNSRKGQ